MVCGGTLQLRLVLTPYAYADGGLGGAAVVRGAAASSRASRHGRARRPAGMGLASADWSGTAGGRAEDSTAG